MKIGQAWTTMRYLGCVAIFLSALANAQPVRIACVGTSITAGINLDVSVRYPTRLQTMLGNGYVTGNFGVVGSAVIRTSKMPYCTTASFRSVFTFAPQWIVIELGTNDSPTFAWDSLNGKVNFPIDMRWLIDTFQTMASVKKIWLCTTPPAFSDYHSINETIISQQIVPIIRQIAAAKGLGLADVHDQLLPFPEVFSDGVHPNSEGAGFIAQVVFDAIKSQSRVENTLISRRTIASGCSEIHVLGLRTPEEFGVSPLQRVFDLRGKRLFAEKLPGAIQPGAFVELP
jgi:lysophospholipase L1-like esterase